MADLPQSNRLLSVEAVIALILALVNLALDQADIHIMIISWISIIICLALAIDALRRSAWVADPKQGKTRFWAGFSGLVLVFVTFGLFLSLHKKAEANKAQVAERVKTQPLPIQPESPKAAPLPSRQQQPMEAKSKPAPKSESTPRIGNDNTLVNMPTPPVMGNGNTMIGPTDSKGNTIINRGGTAIGNGATADPTSIAIGAGAHAGGGINIQQRTSGDHSPIINSPITVGDIPKNIAPQDLRTLTTYFSKCQNKATVQITADQFSGVTPFPEQYYGALKGAGWTMLEDGVNQYMGFAAPGKRFQGAMIRVRGEPLKPQEKASFDPSDPVACIGHSIEAFQIPTTLNRDHNQRDGVITIDFQGGFPH